MKQLFLFILFTCSVFICKAQSYEPLDLSKKIFSRDTFPEIKRYSIDEYEGHPNGRDLSNKIKTKFILLDQNAVTAVVAMTITDSLGKGLDTYLHFKKDTVWKLCAFRALAMTGIIAKVNDDLSALTPKQIDSVIASPHTKAKDHRLFKSKEEYRYLLGNTSLVLSLDDELIAHFNKNKLAFEDLKNSLVKHGVMTKSRGLKEMKGLEVYKNHLALLFIDNAFPDWESSKNNLNFLIGGITDNSVGYLYIKNKKDVPKMNPSHFIMIREIGDGWYLYKTT
jgi:hypothetical protein